MFQKEPKNERKNARGAEQGNWGYVDEYEHGDGNGNGNGESPLSSNSCCSCAILFATPF